MRKSSHITETAIKSAIKYVICGW